MQRIKTILNTKHFKRFAPLAVVIIVALVTFTTCLPRAEPEPENPDPATISEKPPVSDPTAEQGQEPRPLPQPDPEPEPEPGYIWTFNPLTGLPTDTDISNNRPLAIMVNNAPEAQPQHGVSMADIIYEILVEGGRTRMMALYQDVSDVGIIGSIRSSRLYYVDVVQGYDAIYIFAGGSPEAYTALSNRNITRLDGVAGHADIYYRDSNRRSSLGFEHSLMTTGERIMRWLPTYDFRLTHEPGYERALTFTEDGTPQSGSPASEFAVRFSSGKSTTFSYEADDALYYLGQFNRAYRDGNDETQLAFTNVLILKTSVSQIAGDREGRIRVATTGSGAGYFACGGEYAEITWSRAENTSQFEYKLSDGSDLVFGQGKTYICIIPNNVEIDFT